MEKTTLGLIKNLFFAKPKPLYEEDAVPSQVFFYRVLPLMLIVYYVYPVLIREFKPDIFSRLMEPGIFFLLLILPNIILAVGLGVIVFFTAGDISFRRKLGMLNWRNGYVWSGMAICFILLVVNGLLNLMMEDLAAYCGIKAPAPAIISLLNGASTMQTIWLVFMVLFIAPVLEELIFRRFIYSYCESTLGMLPAILMTSTWFAIIHDAWIQWPGLFILGVVFQLSYIFSRSIYFPITIHFFNNLISICIYFLWM